MAIAHNFKRQIKNKRVTHQFLIFKKAIAKYPLIPLPPTKNQRFNPSSVS